MTDRAHAGQETRRAEVTDVPAELAGWVDEAPDLPDVDRLFARALAGEPLDVVDAPRRWSERDRELLTTPRAERLEYVLAFLSETGYTKVEPYSFHGLTAEQFDALARKYDLDVPSRHTSTSEANIADAKLLGQHWTACSTDPLRRSHGPPASGRAAHGALT